MNLYKSGEIYFHESKCTFVITGNVVVEEFSILEQTYLTVMSDQFWNVLILIWRISLCYVILKNLFKLTVFVYYWVSLTYSLYTWESGYNLSPYAGFSYLIREIEDSDLKDIDFKWISYLYVMQKAGFSETQVELVRLVLSRNIATLQTFTYPLPDVADLGATRPGDCGVFMYAPYNTYSNFFRNMTLTSALTNALNLRKFGNLSVTEIQMALGMAFTIKAFIESRTTYYTVKNQHTAEAKDVMSGLNAPQKWNKTQKHNKSELSWEEYCLDQFYKRDFSYEQFSELCDRYHRPADWNEYNMYEQWFDADKYFDGQAERLENDSQRQQRREIANERRNGRTDKRKYIDDRDLHYRHKDDDREDNLYIDERDERKAGQGFINSQGQKRFYLNEIIDKNSNVAGHHRHECFIPIEDKPQDLSPEVQPEPSIEIVPVEQVAETINLLRETKEEQLIEDINSTKDSVSLETAPVELKQECAPLSNSWLEQIAHNRPYGTKTDKLIHMHPQDAFVLNAKATDQLLVDIDSTTPAKPDPETTYRETVGNPIISFNWSDVRGPTDHLVGDKIAWDDVGKVQEEHYNKHYGESAGSTPKNMFSGMSKHCTLRSTLSDMSKTMSNLIHIVKDIEVKVSSIEDAVPNSIHLGELVSMLKHRAEGVHCTPSGLLGKPIAPRSDPTPIIQPVKANVLVHMCIVCKKTLPVESYSNKQIACKDKTCKKCVETDLEQKEAIRLAEKAASKKKIEESKKKSSTSKDVDISKKSKKTEKKSETKKQEEKPMKKPKQEKSVETPVSKPADPVNPAPPSERSPEGASPDSEPPVETNLKECFLCGKMKSAKFFQDGNAICDPCIRHPESKPLVKTDIASPESAVKDGLIFNLENPRLGTGVGFYADDGTKIGNGEFVTYRHDENRIDTFIITNKHIATKQCVRYMKSNNLDHTTSFPHDLSKENHWYHGGHTMDCSFLLVDKDTPSKFGSVAFDITNVVNTPNNPPQCALTLQIYRNGKWMVTPSQRNGGYDVNFNIVYYNAQTMEGDCGKAVLRDNKMIGIHAGTKNNKLDNYFLYFGAEFKAFFNFL